MKTVIQIVMVALVVGGLSAGGSFYWRQQLAKSVASAVDAKIKDLERAWDGELTREIADDEQTAEKRDVDDEDKIDSTPTPTANIASTESTSPGPAAAVRPPFDEFGDEAGNLINIVRKKAAAVSHKEKQVVEREEAMNLILSDLRFEQAHATRLKKTLLAESKRAYKAANQLSRNASAETSATEKADGSDGSTAKDSSTDEQGAANPKVDGLLRDKAEAMHAAENANSMIRSELEELRKQIQELQTPKEPVDRSGMPEEIGNIKKTAERLDSMPPEETAKILKEMVEKRRVAGVIAILNTMDSRQSAKVLSAISSESPELAAELVERLKKLKSY